MYRDHLHGKYCMYGQCHNFAARQSRPTFRAPSTQPTYHPTCENWFFTDISTPLFPPYPSPPLVYILITPCSFQSYTWNFHLSPTLLSPGPLLPLLLLLLLLITYQKPASPKSSLFTIISIANTNGTRTRIYLFYFLKPTTSTTPTQAPYISIFPFFGSLFTIRSPIQSVLKIIFQSVLKANF